MTDIKGIIQSSKEKRDPGLIIYNALTSIQRKMAELTAMVTDLEKKVFQIENKKDATDLDVIGLFQGMSIHGRDGEMGPMGPEGPCGPCGPAGESGMDAEAIDEAKIVATILTQLPEAILPDTPIQIADKLNTLEEKVDWTVIRGLKQIIANLEKNIKNINREKGGGGGGGGLGLPVSQSFTGNGVLTSFTLSSRVSANGKAIWVYYNGQWLVNNTHYTVSGSTLSLTFTPEADTTVDVLFIRT